MIKRFLAAAFLCAADAPAMAVELPPEIAKQGSIKVAIVPNYPPLEFKDPATNTLTGFDVELGEALGRKLGLKIVWQETSFDQMMPAIATGRVDAILSGMTDMASRQDTATFVDYLRNGPRFFVQQSRAAEFKDTKAFCGKKVGASRRTSFPKMIAAWSDANCGGNPIKYTSARKARPMPGPSSGRDGSTQPCRAARRFPTSWTSSPELMFRSVRSSRSSSPDLLWA